MLANPLYQSIALVMALLSVLLLPNMSQAQSACAPWLDHQLPQLHSKNTLSLCKLTAQHPVLLVNTASHCGYTKQFSALEALYQKYKDQGLVVIGFPSNSFQQEAKSEEETASVCYKNFGVTFYMTKPVEVKGNGAHPIFQYLAQSQGAPNWNFNKYLIAPDGTVLKRYNSRVTPLDSPLEQDITHLF